MKSLERLRVVNKIKELEKKGLWSKDVEDDPETKVLLPDQIDYLGEKWTTRAATRFANRAAIRYFEKQIKRGNFVIKEIRGLENYRAVQGGAMITCNHFNPYDNYAVFRAIRKDLGSHNLYKIIREGNYTSFPGFYGFIFRHCNTLPLSSDLRTMKKFFHAVDTLLARGEKILIYPEQGMWWNYRKPRPMQNGAFKFAVRGNVPIIPVFITMEDSAKMDADGFPIQEYTLHFLKPIYPDQSLPFRERADAMKQLNYDAWKQVYEDFYQIPLEYETEEAQTI